MQMRYVRVLIDRNEHLTIPRDVVPWEIPVMQLIHGNEKIILTGEESFVERDFPDAGTEFDRLAARYKSDNATETPYVVMVYGQFPHGIRKLDEAIQEERDAAARDAQTVSVEDEIVAPTPAIRVAGKKAQAARTPTEIDV